MRNWKFWCLALLLVPCLVIATRFDVDFVNLHFAARLLSSHDFGQIYAKNGNVGRYFYGPLSLVLIEPLGAMAYAKAKLLWNVLQTVSYILFWLLLARLYPFLSNRSVRWGWLLVWIVAINPIHNNFQSNNIQLMLMVALLTAELLVETDNPVSGFLGAALAAACGAIKVFPFFIAAFYFLTRGRAVRAGVIAGILLSLALPFVYFGFTPGLALTKGFLVGLGSYHQENSLLTTEDILCLPSLLARAFGSQNFVVEKLVPLAAAALFLLFAWARRTSVRLSDRAGLHFWALALAVMTVINPSTRPHYFIFFVPAFCSLLEMLYREGVPALYAVPTLLSAALIALTAQGVVGKHLNDQLELWSVPTIGTLLLCLGLTVALLQRKEIYLQRALGSRSY